MRAMTALPVDDDILDRIFTFLPDFESLGACLLTCKAFYQVYLRHPKSICRSVATNIVGPVDDALNLIMFETPERDEENYVDNFLHLPTFNETFIPASASPDNISRFLDVSGVAMQWEEVFGRTHKDRRPLQSQLSPVESNKFLRSVYRLMLFHKCFQYSNDDDEFFFDDLEIGPDDVQALFDKRVDFLSRFSTQDLLELRVVAHFIATFQELDENNTISVEEIFSYGPEDILDNCRSLGQLRPTDDDLHKSDLIQGYFFRPLEKVLKGRNAKSLPVDDKMWSIILDKTNGNHDTCEHCGQVRGFNLWNTSNWQYFSQFRPRHNSLLLSSVPGQLLNHYSERSRIRGTFFDFSHDPSTYFVGIFDHKEEDFQDWDANQWTCAECLMKICQDGFCRWWVTHRATSGAAMPTDDCWYGWNCRTQTHNHSHANRLNHFCKPVRGDGA